MTSATIIATSSHFCLCNSVNTACSSSMEPGMWTCTICSLTMAVGDGPSHLASDEHMVHLSNFNGRILEFRLAELNLGLQGFEYVTSDKGMPWRAWPCPDYAPCTIEAEANHADTLTDGLGSTGTTSWVCKTCDRTMHEHSKLEHLAGKAHAKMLGSKSMIPLEDACRKPLISVKNFWTCPSCKAILEVPKKAYHHCSISESKASNIDGPLDEFFHSFASFHYVPSAPPATSFGLLQRYLQQQLKWTHESRENEELWRAYQAALTEEFNLWFGVEDNLEAWQSLCRALRVSPLPATIRLCRTVGFLINTLSWFFALIPDLGCSRLPRQHY